MEIRMVMKRPLQIMELSEEMRGDVRCLTISGAALRDDEGGNGEVAMAKGGAE